MESIAAFIVALCALYAAAGAIFAAVFATVLVQRLDPAAANSGVGFRVLIFPGAVALWPLLLTKCLREVTMTAEHRRLHRRTWFVLAILLPALFLLSRLL